jgi:hypothetical protein
MTVDEQLLYEARVRMRQAGLAAAAGVLVVVAIAIQLGGSHAKVNEQTLGLITANKRFARDVIGSSLEALGSFALAATLGFLFKITRARKADVRPTFTGILGIAGGVISGLSIVVYVIVYGAKAHQFVTHGSQTYEQASQLTTSPALVIPQLLNYLGGLLLAVGLVLTSLNAMRVGLLTRFMGYLGIFAGALVIIPLVPIPIVEGYWLVALAYLFSGRWPSGVPLAWRTGRAEQLPSSPALREPSARPGGAGMGRWWAPRPAPAPGAETVEPEAAAPEAVGAPARTRAATPKRKRKRRR